MVNRSEVSFQIVMGPANPGPVRTGSPAELYARFFGVVCIYIPPFEVWNDKLATGLEHAGEHGIHLRWTPVQINQAEYACFCQDLRESTVRKYEQVDAPANVRSWEEWSRWIYTTQVEPKLAVRSSESTSRDQIKLRREYRKALAAGDMSTAEALASEIRRRFDASFS